MKASTAETTLAICAIGALVVSVLGVLLSVVVSRSTSKDTRRALAVAEDAGSAVVSTAEAARASAESAAEMVIQQGRIADSIDALGTRGDQEQAALARALSDRRVSWVLRHMTGSTYELANAGTVSAYNVRITAENVARFDPPEIPSEWTAGSGAELFVVTTSMPGVPTIVVEWTTTPIGVEATLETWRRPLPPRVS